MDQDRDTHACGAVSGIRIMDRDGGFGPPARLGWTGGRFALGGDPQPDDLDGDGLWLIPGLVDAHLHAAWHAFDARDRESLAPEETRAKTADSLARTLAAGFTSVRDAGGLGPELLAEIDEDPESPRPRVQCSIELLDRAAADAAGGLDRAVERVLERGARWVKLVATAGVASPAGEGLEPSFARAEMHDAVRRADRAGAGVMVHAWGGSAIDDAIEAGATSIEHGVFLTDGQARRAAERGMTLVPTVRIYRLVRRMIDSGSLPSAFRARVDEAVGAHPEAVRRARDAGLAIALGTDYGTGEQHGTNRLEFDALVDAGLAPEEALVAATRGGAELLARVADPGPHADLGPYADPGPHADLGPYADLGTSEDAVTRARLAGTIADGAAADAVILRRDPRVPGALREPGAVVAVILGGRRIDPSTPTGSRSRKDSP